MARRTRTGGVVGKNTAGGQGVFGSSETGWGVEGVTPNGTAGVYGASGLSNGSGVEGHADGKSAAGVFGVSEAGSGIWGRSTSGNGVYGESGPNGYAVYTNGRMSAKVLEIQGGSDLAERFEVSSNTAADPGMLMVIDPGHPGKLMASASAYDVRVAGVVSGAGGINPGLTLHQNGVLEGDHVIAIAGRVYVQADATNAPIQPGDLLTSSDIPETVMKAVDRNRAAGAIIGKAMTGLDSGTGLVLVLVNLQ